MAAAPAAEAVAGMALAGATSGEGSEGASEAGERWCGMLRLIGVTLSLLGSLHAVFCTTDMLPLKLHMRRGRRGTHQLRPLHAHLCLIDPALTF